MATVRYSSRTFTAGDLLKCRDCGKRVAIRANGHPLLVIRAAGSTKMISADTLVRAHGCSWPLVWECPSCRDRWDRPPARLRRWGRSRRRAMRFSYVCPDCKTVLRQVRKG